MKQPMVILAGPTAVGKTALSIQLAKAIGGAVISADSVQVYRYMDIGSGKATKEEMQNIPHYLINEFMPKEEFHVVKFQRYAKFYLKQIYENGLIPILVGGTGFYIQALLYDIDFTEQKCDSEYRRSLEKLAGEKGSAYLHEMLSERDEKAAAAIHPNNIKRMIRALEFYEESGGKQISAHNARERAKDSPYNFAYFVLNDERGHLYERIDARVDEMMQNGLLNEVRKLKAMGCTKDMVSMQGLGYKELFAYLAGECSLEEAVCLIKRNTRHFAKRQLTWFKRERETIWVNKQEFSYNDNAILSFVLETLKVKQIISSGG